jgi:hypothetical protein
MISLVTLDGCRWTSLDSEDVFAGDAVDKGELFVKSKLVD